MLASMFGAANTPLSFRLEDHDLLITTIVVESVIIAHWLCRDTPLEVLAARVPWWTVSIGLAFMFLALMLSSSESQGFLYFQY